MTTWNSTFVTVLGVVVLSACASSAGDGASSAPDVQPPGDAPAQETTTAAPAGTGGATFSEVQADRGRDIFRAACTECHYSSEFSDSQFKFKWSRRDAGSLYQLIQTSMPETDPGSLSPEETVDLVSYILRMNGFTAGAQDLAADRAVLDGISLASIRDD